MKKLGNCGDRRRSLAKNKHKSEASRILDRLDDPVHFKCSIPSDIEIEEFIENWDKPGSIAVFTEE